MVYYSDISNIDPNKKELYKKKINGIFHNPNFKLDNTSQDKILCLKHSQAKETEYKSNIKKNQNLGFNDLQEAIHQNSLEGYDEKENLLQENKINKYIYIENDIYFRQNSTFNPIINQKEGRKFFNKNSTIGNNV